MTTIALPVEPRSMPADPFVEAPSLGERRELRMARARVVRRWSRLKTRKQRQVEKDNEERAKADRLPVPDAVPRPMLCGVAPVGSGVQRTGGVGGTRVGLSMSASGVGIIQGVQHCASPHACPSCSASIRQARASELERGVENFRRTVPGGEVLLLTMTIRHGRFQPLEQTLGACLGAWSAIIRGPAWLRCRAKYRIAGYVRSFELTLGSNGWHPHIHAVLFISERLSDEELEALRINMFGRWAGALERAGLERPTLERGIRIDRTEVGQGGVGAYICKPEAVEGEIGRGARRVATEILRGDLKSSWSGLSPFELLDFDGTDLHAWAMEKWQEYEHATWAKRTTIWSRSARALLGLPPIERTDQEIVEEPDPAPTVCGLLDFSQWRELRSRPDALVRVLGMMEQGAHAQACWWLETIVGDVERGPGWAAVPGVGPPGADPPDPATASGGGS